MSGVATAIIASAVIVGGVSYYQGEKQASAIKKAQNAATDANNKAIADAKAARDAAQSQAEAQIANKKRTMASSNTVFTNPLGLGDQASTAKKSLLGL
jgi:hypothetical protein